MHKHRDPVYADGAVCVLKSIFNIQAVFKSSAVSFKAWVTPVFIVALFIIARTWKQPRIFNLFLSPPCTDRKCGG